MRKKLQIINYKLQTRRKAIFFIVFICHLSFIICHLSAHEVHAQSLSLTLTPPLLEVMIKPGKSITQVFRLTNEGDPVFISPRIVEYTENGIKESSSFIPESWFSFIGGSVAFQQPFLLHTGETRGLVLRINPPAQMPDTNVYRVLLFETVPNPADTSTSDSTFQSKIGSILLLNITASGVTKKSAFINRFSFPDIIDSFDTLRGSIEVQNTGTTYFRPIGKINLSGTIGKASYDVDPYVFLAGQTRILTTNPETDTEHYSLNLPGFYLGKYEISTEFTLDDGSLKVSGKKIFYALPWKLCGSLIFLSLFVILIRKRRKSNGNHQ